MNKKESTDYHRLRAQKLRKEGYKQISTFVHKDNVEKVKAYIKLLEAQRLFELAK